MFGILTVLLIILTIIIATQKTAKNVKNTPHVTLSKPSPTHSPSPTPTITPTPTPQPTSPPPTSTPTNKPNPQPQTVTDFQYPNSNVVNINGTAIFESVDDPKKITDWYKDKIKSMGMTATSFIQTNTNDNILNKLVGANGNKKVSVEITKQNNQSTAKISVIL